MNSNLHKMMGPTPGQPNNDVPVPLGGGTDQQEIQSSHKKSNQRSGGAADHASQSDRRPAKADYQQLAEEDDQ
jgi:hypothetical protein